MPDPVDLTPEDLALDPAAWLRAFAYRQERGQNDITVDLELFSGLCRRLLAAEAEARETKAEIAGLRSLADSLAERVYQQAELLARRAEKSALSPVVPEGCELCGDQVPLILAARCHLTAPLAAILEGDVLTLRCYLPECGREVVRLRVAGVAEGG